MCGIGGVWGGGSASLSLGLPALFADALAHRGPDGEGFLAIPADPSIPARSCRRSALPSQPVSCGRLVHRRLSIIDLDTGDQPMQIQNGRFWIVFNGEIYNYRELRQHLATLPNTDFHTRSDTEVILQVYRHWGIDGFRQLNGIFALALYDGDRRELVLARDPVGVKPLYWARGAREVVAFASEIRPLLRTGLAKQVVSPERLAQYLFYRFVPAPGTLWETVEKVVPGHALTFDATARLIADDDFAAPPPVPISGSAGFAAELLAPQLTQAVQRQLVADVPVGLFLSGGLDSSLVLSALGERARGVPTFAVGFPGERGYPSELAIAERAARLFQTQHASQLLEPQGYFARLPEAIVQVEEPVVHPGMLMQSDLAAVARQKVKVVLTGQGADEPLGGYPRHQVARLSTVLGRGLTRLAGGRLMGWWGNRRESVARLRQVLAAPAGVEWAAALFSPITPREAAEMVQGCSAVSGSEAVLEGVAHWWRRGEGLDDVARALYVDVRTSLAEDLLLVADKTSMAHSLEARVPFLDLDYLRQVESIPGPTRVAAWGSRKRIQHLIGRNLLPAELSRSLERSSGMLRRKRGFDVPVTSWFRESMQEQLVEFLTGPQSVLPDYLRGDLVRSRVRAFLSGSGRDSRQAMAFYMLELWLRGYNERALTT
jgi:asparagine synthase (glutamine-hydrolysing)